MKIKIIIPIIVVILSIGLVILVNHNSYYVSDTSSLVQSDKSNFRIIYDHNTAKFMPQMIFGGKWENMSDTWLYKEQEAKYIISNEINKHRGQRYEVVYSKNFDL